MQRRTIRLREIHDQGYVIALFMNMAISPLYTERKTFLLKYLEARAQCFCGCVGSIPMVTWFLVKFSLCNEYRRSKHGSYWSDTFYKNFDPLTRLEIMLNLQCRMYIYKTTKISRILATILKELRFVHGKVCDEQTCKNTGKNSKYTCEQKVVAGFLGTVSIVILPLNKWTR